MISGTVILQAAQQTADVPVLRRWEPFGADILALLLDPDSEANIHPFATLSWSFATPLLLKQIAEMVWHWLVLSVCIYMRCITIAIQNIFNTLLPGVPILHSSV